MAKPDENTLHISTSWGNLELRVDPDDLTFDVEFTDRERTKVLLRMRSSIEHLINLQDFLNKVLEPKF
jgi:hypothetical protein